MGYHCIKHGIGDLYI